MTFSLGTRSRRNLEGVHPDLIRIVETAIITSAVDFGVAARALRTAKEQAALYAQGRSKPGSIVTQKDGYKAKSNHQAWPDGLGHAVDLTPWDGGWVFDQRAFQMYPAIASAMSQAAKALGLADHLIWGAAWGVPMSRYGSSQAEVMTEAEVTTGWDDFAHFQLE